MPIFVTQGHSLTNLASLMKLISSKKFDRSMSYFVGRVTIFILGHNISAHFISYPESKDNILNICIIVASQTLDNMG